MYALTTHCATYGVLLTLGAAVLAILYLLLNPGMFKAVDFAVLL